MSTATLLPDPALLHLEYIVPTDEAITLVVDTCQAAARCPLCGQPSTRVHSSYQRRAADLPWNGIAVRLRLHTRKFFCDTPGCERAIFTEPLPMVLERYARKTNRLRDALHLIGYALGGEAGARVAAGLAMGTSPDTLLRQIRREAPPAGATPRVLGVDDFAFRRGHTYGTILVDLEKRCLVDLLPDRQAQTLERWLQEHPGVEVISRDRAGAYAEGARKGAPDAIQVADRWHLLKNLGDALEKLLIRRHRQLGEAAQRLAAVELPQEASLERATEQVPPAPTRAEQEQTHRRERRQIRYEQVRTLFAQGYNQSAIARRTGFSRKTIRKYLRTEECPHYPACRRSRPGVLTRFDAYLKRRWEEGCHNAAQLLRELRAQGYMGQYSSLKDHLQQWRAHLPAQERRTTGPVPRPRRREDVPSPSSARWWLLGHYSKSDPEKQALQQNFVTTLVGLCPEIETGQRLAQEFVGILKDRLASELDGWLERAKQCAAPELAGLAEGLYQDKAAVLAALTSPWSNGQTEGQVNRLKLVKRSMYGRANFDLLRARTLAA